MLRNEARIIISCVTPSRCASINWQTRHAPAGVGQVLVLVDCAEFGQAPVAVTDGARVRRLDERKLVHFTELESEHAQDHAGQRRAQDFRIAVLRPRVEIFFVVQAHADSRTDAAAAALALLGSCLRDRLDVQALKLVALRVALDARGAGINHIADARHGQRGLRDIGGEDDAANRARLEHSILFVGRKARVQRQDFGRAIVAPRQCQVSVANLALAGQEDQCIAARVLARDFIECGDDLLALGQVVALGNGVRVFFP
jgi:hypothetical protein